MQHNECLVALSRLIIGFRDTDFKGDWAGAW